MTSGPKDIAIDLMSGSFFGDDPYPAFAWMRKHSPVFYDEVNDLWAFALYEDVKTAGTDSETYSNAGGIRPKWPAIPMMIDFDAPDGRPARLIFLLLMPPKAYEREVRVLASIARAVVPRRNSIAP